MNREPRNVMIYEPAEKGHPMLSIKVRPNNPCVCGSGKKQKRCCGSDSKLMATLPKKNTIPLS